MARRAALSFGSLNPFGGGDTSFASFNVGKSSTVDASQEAYLQFQKIETDWQAGRIDDATYQAAFQTYAASLEAGTSTAINAAARIESMQYSMARDSLLQQVQSGQASWSQLVSFDQQSLGGLNPGSQEYRDREARMWASQVNEFQEAEQQVADDLSAERINYTQALSWYEQARTLYVGNYGLTEAIDSTIKKVKTEIVREQDNAILNKWKEGTISLDAFLAYSANVQATEPDSPRARTWAENSVTATDQAVEKSLNYRYGLTEEYRDLEMLVASAKAPTGNTSVSKSIQYVYTANGWVAKTVYESKYHAPSQSEVQAYKELQVKVAAAKKRMGEITKLVGTMPGGWVNEDDILRKLGDQQAKMVKGSPAWIEVQEKIDYFNERKRSDEILRNSGVVVNLPTVRSEKTAASDVSAFEKPTAPSKGGVKVPPPPAATTSGGGGGTSGGGGKAALPGTTNKNATSAPGNFLFQALGPANSKSKNVTTIVDTGGNKISVAYKATGLPVGMNSTDFKALYTGMTDAVKNGETVWVNPATGIGYVLPPDPSDRLAIMSGLDAANIAQRRLEYVTNPNKTTEKAYKTATYKANTNTLHVMDDPYAGVPLKFLPVATTPGRPAVDQRGLQQSTIDAYLKEDREAAPIAAALDYMGRAEEEVTALGAKAKAALAKGDKEAAYKYAAAAEYVLGDSGLMQKASYWASYAEAKKQGLVSAGAEMTETGGLEANYNKMMTLAGEGADAWASELLNKSGVEEVASVFNPEGKGENYPYQYNPVTGQPKVGGDGSFVMAPGWVRVLQNGKITEKQMGSAPDLKNNMVPSDEKLIAVRLQVGDTFRDVMTTFEIGRIGQAVQADGTRAFIDGKKIDVMWDGKRYQLAQDPMNPQRWVPLTTKGLTWTLPTGATVVNGSAQLGQTGSQIVFTAPGTQYNPGAGQRYVMAMEEDGTYMLHPADAQNNLTGNPISAGSETGIGILGAAGISLDVGAMDSAQQSYYRTGINGVYLGDPNAILLQGVKMTQFIQSTLPGGMQGPGSNFLLRPLSNFTPKVSKPKAPATVQVATPYGGIRTVATGALPAPVGQPSQYEGAGGTVLTPSLAPYIPPSSLTQVPTSALASALTPTYNATPKLSQTTGFTTVRATTPYVAPSSISGGIKGTPYVAPSSLTQTPKATALPKITPPPVVKKPPTAVNTSPTKL